MGQTRDRTPEIHALSDNEAAELHPAAAKVKPHHDAASTVHRIAHAPKPGEHGVLTADFPTTFSAPGSGTEHDIVLKKGMALLFVKPTNDADYGLFQPEHGSLTYLVRYSSWQPHK